MKITRKIQQQIENKIRHAVATGRLHPVERHSGTGSDARSDSDKPNGNGMSQSK